MDALPGRFVQRLGAQRDAVALPDVGIDGNVRPQLPFQCGDLAALALQQSGACDLCTGVQMLHAHKVRSGGIRHSQCRHAVPVDEHAEAQRGEALPDGLRHNAEIGDGLRRGLLPDGHVAHILQDHALHAAFGQNARFLQRLLRDEADAFAPVTVAAGQGTGLHHADDSALHAFAPPSFAA